MSTSARQPAQRNRRAVASSPPWVRYCPRIRASRTGVGRGADANLPVVDRRRACRQREAEACAAALSASWRERMPIARAGRCRRARPWSKAPKATPQPRAGDRVSDCEHGEEQSFDGRAFRGGTPRQSARDSALHTPKPAAPQAQGRRRENGEPAAQRRSMMARSATAGLSLTAASTPLA
jgi:hypothetical protein